MRQRNAKMWQSKHKKGTETVQHAEMFTLQTNSVDFVFKVMYSVYSENKQKAK